MRTKEQIQNEIEKLQQELEDLKRDYRSRGNYKICLVADGIEYIRDTKLLASQINNNLRFDTEKQAQAAADDMRYILKLHALANHLNDEGEKEYFVGSDRHMTYFYYYVGAFSGIPRFTECAAKKACEILNKEKEIL